MSTLSRYIGGRVVSTFLIAFASVLLLIALVDLIELLRRDGGEAGFWTRAMMAGLHAPSISLKALPFVMLLAAMWSYIQLARSSELVAAWAAGRSFWGMARPGIAAAAMIGIVAVTIYGPLATAALAVHDRMKAYHFEGRGTLFSVTSEGLWLREAGEGGRIVIRAARTNARGTELRDATFFRFGEDDALEQRIDTPIALLNQEVWMLTGARIRTVDPAGSAPPEEQRKPFISIPTRLTPEEIQNSFAPPDSISFWALPRVIEAMQAAGFSARRHEAHWQSLLALPALLAAMTLIAAAFAVRPPRFVSFGVVALGCALTGFAFYFMSDVSMALGASGAAPPALGAWAPVVGATFLGLALAFYFREI